MKSDRILTSDRDVDGSAENGADVVLGDTLVSARILSPGVQYPIEVLRAEVSQLPAVLEPPILRLRVSCNSTTNLSISAGSLLLDQKLQRQRSAPTVNLEGGRGQQAYLKQ